MSSAMSVERYNKALEENRVFRAALVEALRLQSSRNWNQCFDCETPITCKAYGCKTAQVSCPIERVLRRALDRHPAGHPEGL